MLVSDKGNIYAGTLFGLFYFDDSGNLGQSLELPVKDKRIQWLD